MGGDEAHGQFTFGRQHPVQVHRRLAGTGCPRAQRGRAEVGQLRLLRDEVDGAARLAAHAQRGTGATQHVHAVDEGAHERVVGQAHAVAQHAVGAGAAVGNGAPDAEELGVCAVEAGVGLHTRHVAQGVLQAGAALRAQVFGGHAGHGKRRVHGGAGAAGGQAAGGQGRCAAGLDLDDRQGGGDGGGGGGIGLRPGGGHGCATGHGGGPVQRVVHSQLSVCGLRGPQPHLALWWPPAASARRGFPRPWRP